MDFERLRQIEEIYHAALDMPRGERESFLENHCGEDENLRLEIESLLGFEETPNNFLDALPESVIAEIFSAQNKTIDLTGKTIGHYKIIKLLGRGGMGEVFLAEDINLDRRAALKCLPPEYVENKDRMNRFIREAKAASGLNHPNIITIYEINEFEGTHYIATEYIDGKTLSDFIKSEPPDVDSALEIATQIASALDEAHSAGIIHRDVKPDNVMIRSNGLVKILDFGIAKLIEPQNERLEISMPPLSKDSYTAIANPQATAVGLIIGTANYMSPEQADGGNIDARTDIFSFGVVFYEMLTGKHPFEGQSPAETLSAIPHREAEPLETYAIPAEIGNIVAKCLRKNKDERYQTIKDVLTDLKQVDRNFASSEKPRRRVYSTNGTEPNALNRRTETGEDFQNATKHLSRGKRAPNKFLASGFIFSLLLFGAVFGYRYFTVEKQIKSIAVMPFVNESGNKDVEYLSDGMTESLISSLSNIPQLSIKARSSVFTYKNKEFSPLTIGAELKVDAVLLGRLIQRGDELKVNLELVDTATLDVLWSANYERKMNRLVSLESEIATAVAENLRLKLSRAEQVQIAKTYTANSEAHQLYLKGRFHWNKRNKKDFDKAVEYFKQAIEKDANYALAYAGLADTYALIPLYGSFRPKEYIPLAKESALRAIELDKNLAEPHASLGYITNTYDYDWEAAEREYKTAISLNPNYATAHQWYAEHLAFRGMTDKALDEISKALELDPFSVVINRMKGNVLGFAGRNDEAIVHLQKTLEMYPENAFVRFNLGDAFAAKKMYAEAVEQYLVALKQNGTERESLKKLQTGYKTKGWKGFWLEHLAILEKEQKTLSDADKNPYSENESIAFAYAATGNKDKALEYLGRAYEERDPNLVTITTSGVYDFLRDDLRYKELIKNIGLSE